MAAHQCAGKGGGVAVARAVHGYVHAVGEVVLCLVAVVACHTQFAGLKADTCEHHVLGAKGMEALEGLLHVGLVVLGAVFLAQEQGSLGEVGHDDVGTVAQAAHLQWEVVVEARIEFAAVAHHGVHDAQGTLVGNLLHDAEDVGNLCLGDVTGVEGVECNVLLLPLSKDVGHLVGEVEEGPGGVACRVVGKHRAGQYAALYSASGDDGQCHGERALAYAGNVLDGKKSFVCHIYGCLMDPLGPPARGRRGWAFND